MFASGAVILVFLVQHLVLFKFGRWYLYRNAAGVCVAGAILGGFLVTAAGTCALAHRPVTQAQIEKARAAQPALEAQVAAQTEGGRK